MSLGMDLYISHECKLCYLGIRSLCYILVDNLEVLQYNFVNNCKMVCLQMLGIENLVHREMVHKDFVELQDLLVVLLVKFDCFNNRWFTILKNDLE